MSEIFIRNTDGNFTIGSVSVSRSLFFALEPSYSEIEDLTFLRYDGESRQIVTKNKQYTIQGSWDSGNRYIARQKDFADAMSYSTEEGIKDESSIRQLVEESRTPRSKRRAEYPPIEDLVVALWENLIEKKTKKESGVERIQKTRKSLKDKYPTENTDAISQDTTKIN